MSRVVLSPKEVAGYVERASSLCERVADTLYKAADTFTSARLTFKVIAAELRPQRED